MSMAASGFGSDVSRIDGVAKVTGTAAYTADRHPGGAVHAVLVAATIAKGRVVSIDLTAALRVRGVVTALAHGNMEVLQPSGFYFAGGHSFQSLHPLQTDQVAYRGQTVAVVLAETLEAAREGASKVKPVYEAAPANVALDADEASDVRQAETLSGPMFADRVAGDAERALSQAAVVVDVRYETPAQHHNPIELVSVLAEWDGDALTVHATAQGSEVIRQGLAVQLGISPEKIRVLAPLTGGSFGQKTALGPHVAMAAVAARRLGRPVMLELPRSQAYHATSFRPATRQRVRIGADRDGRMIAAIHQIRQQTSRHDLMPGFGTDATARLYGIPNFRGEERLVRLDTQTPGFMRAPFEMASVFAFESSVDELAFKLGYDPVEFRLKNDAASDPITGKPFSSRWLGECLRQGAERFGWARRTAEPGSMKGEGGVLIGMGVAVGAYKAATAPTLARARMSADGTVQVSVAASEMGQGITTAIFLAVADRLRLQPENVHLVIGDTAATPQHLTAGSWGTATVVPAIHAAAGRIRDELLRYACETQGGPLHGTSMAVADIECGGVVAPDGRRESFAEIMRRVDRKCIDSEILSLAPGQTAHAFVRAQAGMSAPQGPVYPEFVSFSYAAHFAEVQVSSLTRQIRVARMVSVVDCGRVISLRTARSQATGGLVWGIGAALLEASEVDPRFGGFLNADLAEYLVPVNADIPDLDVSFIDRPDPLLNSAGAKGLGEVTTVGSSAAIVNAIHHATGKRVRHLPVRIDDLFDPVL
jgi:xanthine dehydrogenase YagR molybdenum-binding subunit